MESLVRDYIIKHMNTNGLFTQYQHGFMEGRSCTTNLLATLAILVRGNQKWNPCGHNSTWTFAKAFDTVPHQCLLNKLHSYGIRGKVNEWIKDFLSNRRQRVVVNGA